MVTKELDCKILIFEDDSSILSMLTDFFGEIGAEISTSSDGGGALDLIASVNPDIVLMDVVMPIQDGFSIVRDLRENSNQVPVILLTEKNSIDDKVLGLDSGADDYICKPFSPKELLARVKAQLRRLPDTSNRKDSILHFNELTIDPRTREVHFHMKPVALTKTEFDLLYYLAKNHPEVILHAELYKNVLGYNPGTETKALVMHVMNMRRKFIESGIDTIEIKSVPGVGYKFILQCDHQAVNLSQL